ncbi:uncharacterized protein [Triticum aestivum]|uniref:uncharacterized protein n=1 Tax=Triticum aestivum TaxID=4565 RepID=UPI001D0135B4|nr:uncharacterized protein LOC123060942 [Triticum aestivum]
MVDPTSRSRPSTPWSTSEPTDELTKDRDRLLRHDLQGQDATLLGWIGGKGQPPISISYPSLSLSSLRSCVSRGIRTCDASRARGGGGLLDETDLGVRQKRAPLWFVGDEVDRRSVGWEQLAIFEWKLNWNFCLRRFLQIVHDLFHLEALCELHQNSSNIRPLESRGVIGVLLP